MATLEAPVQPRTSLHSGPFVTEPFYDFRNEETRAACAPPSPKSAASWAASMT